MLGFRLDEEYFRTGHKPVVFLDRCAERAFEEAFGEPIAWKELSRRLVQIGQFDATSGEFLALRGPRTIATPVDLSELFFGKGG